MLPTFLIAGGAKCGTTSLANSLRRHPEIFIPKIKEINFFHADVYWKKGLSWYQKYFNRATRAHSIGEASPLYMISKTACQRIRQTMPTVKLLFLLRNPIARAHSDFWYRKRLGFEERELIEVLSEEAQHQDEEAIEKAIRKAPFGYYRPYVLYPGYYTRRLKTYLDHFPPEQILILLFDDLVHHPGEALNTIQDFLGVHRQELRIEKDNPSKVPRSIFYLRLLNRLRSHHSFLRKMFMVNLTTRELWSSLGERLVAINMQEAPKPPLQEEEYALLVKIFEPEIKGLSRLLGRDLQRWLESANI
jgi:hypothetical protein